MKRTWLILLLGLPLLSFAGEFHLSGEVRYRFEYKDNFDFDRSRDDQDGIHLLRTRLNLDWQADPNLRLFFQLQDARVGGLSVGSRAPYQDQVDIRQGYAEVGKKDGSFLFQIGRMELSYGNERLLGGFNWSNIAQSFDGFRIKTKIQKGTWDFFVVRKVKITYDDFNSWNEDDTLWGTWFSLPATDHHTLDLYGFYRDTGKPIAFGPAVGSGTLGETTLGFRFAGKNVGSWDYLFQGAYQFGDFGEKDIQAFAFIGNIGYTLTGPHRAYIGIEYDWASGDENPEDGTRKTFDNLFPTNHKFYGYMDRASLQNIKDWVIHTACHPFKGVRVAVDYHFLSLDTPADALYVASRKAVRQGEAGFSDNVGRELDITVKGKVHPHFSLLVGYSHFQAGDFLEQTGGGDDGDFFYVQGSYHF